MKIHVRVVLASLLVASTIAPVAASAAQDCDSNAVIYCGATTKSELVNKIQNGDGRHSAASLTASFRARGMTSAEISSSDTVMGQVGRDGSVTINGKVVATGAESVGRQNIAGSTKTGGMWQRPTSVSFQSDSIPAFVYMPGGQFKWAILTSCGNMVFAHPMVAPTPVTPAVQVKPVPAPAPAPAPTQVQTQSQVVVVNVPPAPVAAAPKPAPALPQSGASLTLLPLIMLAAAGSWYHYSRSQLGHALRTVN